MAQGTEGHKVSAVAFALWGVSPVVCFFSRVKSAVVTDGLSVEHASVERLLACFLIVFAVGVPTGIRISMSLYIRHKNNIP